MIRNPNFDSTTGEEAGGQKINNHNHDGIGSVKIKPYNVIPSYVMTNAQLTYYLSRPAIEGDEFNYYNSDTGEYGKYFRLNKVWTKVGQGSANMTQQIGTSLPTASSNSGQYYYLTTTDTLYRSNGTAWIGLN